MQVDDFSVDEFRSLEEFAGESEERLRILIATEEILGPVRNGGIASTYYHLARGLVMQGHEVSVLYLKGEVVENETPEHWVRHFSRFGIQFHYLPMDADGLTCVSLFWQRRYFGFYRWLIGQKRYDVVHTSEWRGGAYYVLMMKKLQLAFQDTIFLVKTSSPHIWNRHYQMQPIRKQDLLCAAFAEQKCVEWADLVIGGSAHLISFMRRIGYRIDGSRVFVQPNVVDFSEVPVEDRRPRREFGTRVESQELVFFGRLETRKGLELFCRALDILVSRGVVPRSVTFLGKEGDVLPNDGNLKPLAFLKAKTADWEFPVDIIADRNQPEALSYLCESDRIAVMPSLIENSTMAVYEALHHRIPFVATKVGGTSELIAAEYHDQVLVAPEGHALADRLEQVLNTGQVIAKPSFDFDDNLRVWYGFHAYLAERLRSRGVDETLRGIRGESNQLEVDIASRAGPLALLVWVDRPDASFERLGESLERSAQLPDAVICCLRSAEASRSAEAALQNLDCKVEIRDCTGESIGEAFNGVIDEGGFRAFVCSATCQVHYAPNFFDVIGRALAAQPQALVGTMFEVEDARVPGGGQCVLPFGGDVASEFMTRRAYGAEMVAFSAELVAEMGLMVPYHLSQGTIHEYVTRGVVRGFEYLVVPDLLFRVADDVFPMATDNPNYEYMRMKALLDAAPLPTKKLLLYLLSEISGDSEAFVSNQRLGEEGRSVWLMRAGGDPSGDDLILAFDTDVGLLRVAARRANGVSLLVNRLIQVPMRKSGRIGDYVTFDMEIMESWLAYGNNVCQVAVTLSGGKKLTRRVRLFKAGDGVYLVLARREVLSPEALVSRLGSSSQAIRNGMAPGAIGRRDGYRPAAVSSPRRGGQRPAKLELDNAREGRLENQQEKFFIARLLSEEDLSLFVTADVAGQLQSRVELRIGEDQSYRIALEPFAASGFFRGELQLQDRALAANPYWCEVRGVTDRREFKRTFQASLQNGRIQVSTKKPVLTLV